MPDPFTRENAERLIPRMEEIYALAKELVKKSSLRAADLKKESDPASQALIRGQIDFLHKQAADVLGEIAGWGAVIKGIDPFLVDFPTLLKGRRVFLCWRQGEPAIRHYHALDAGYASRRKLPDGFE